ncbi:hypothetical protein B566_EDAN001063 [Ephemera danica]|nr:hypothetical protein B566_EDAN001063 [Ephemera danica]
MSESQKALTLVSCANGKLILNEDVLKKVFESEEAKNRPVAIISIAGVFRKGKSFFLNFVLRYLKSKRVQDWIFSGANHMNGFDWKTNLDGITAGITIWPEVFLVNNVAVLLIDTQGLFDRSKTAKEDTFIMVLSSLLSSVQILNHQEDLNSSDLKAFEQKEVNEDLHSVRDILNNFKQIDCFLMPYPGEKVAHDEDYKGDLKHINPIFLDNVKKLVEYLIDNIKAKEVLGEEAKGEYFVKVVKTYVEYINNGTLLVPKSLTQQNETATVAVLVNAQAGAYATALTNVQRAAKRPAAAVFEAMCKKLERQRQL